MMSAEDYMLPCPIKKIFGFECFGCGVQRAFFLVLEGNFSEAFKIYPAIYTLVLLTILSLINYFDKKRNYKKIIVPLIFLNLIIIISAYFLKKN